MDIQAQVESLRRKEDILRKSAVADVGGSLADPFWDALRRWRRRIFRNQHEKREPVFFVLWLVWLFVGSMFYAYAPRSNLGFVKGFYMAINIGYSIGFGYPAETYYGDYIYFSSIYVLLGASFVGVALSFFAEKITKDSETWFTRMEQQKKIEEAIRSKERFFEGNLRAWIFHNDSALKAVTVWLMIVVTMIVYSMVVVKWTFGEAQYFAISTLSTGGHWPIPNDSPTWLFGITGFFTMIGVPVMAVAMAEIAQVLMTRGELDETKATIDATVTKEELEFLQELGLENFDGEIDKAEFIILCMVRMGTDPGLIKYITDRFAELNFYTGRSLSVAELTHGACRFVDGRVRNRKSLLNQSTLVAVSEMDIVISDDSDDDLSFDAEMRESWEKSFRRSVITDCVFEGSDEGTDRDEERNDFEVPVKGFQDEEVPSNHKQGNRDSKSPSSLRSSNGSTSDTSFLRNLVDKFGLSLAQGLPLSDSNNFNQNNEESTTNSSIGGNENRDAMDAMDEMEAGNATTISNPIHKFVDNLRQECAPRRPSSKPPEDARSTRNSIRSSSSTSSEQPKNCMEESHRKHTRIDLGALDDANNGSSFLDISESSFLDTNHSSSFLDLNKSSSTDLNASSVHINTG